MEWDIIYSAFGFISFIGIFIQAIFIKSKYSKEKERYGKKISFLVRISIISFVKSLLFIAFFNNLSEICHLLSSILCGTWSIAFYIPIMIFINLSNTDNDSLTKNGVKFFITITLILMAILALIFLKSDEPSKLRYLDGVACFQFFGFAALYVAFGLKISDKICSQVVVSTGLMTLRAVIGTLCLSKILKIGVSTEIFLNNLIEFILVFSTLLENSPVKPQKEMQSGYELRKVLVNEERR